TIEGVSHGNEAGPGMGAGAGARRRDPAACRSRTAAARGGRSPSFAGLQPGAGQSGARPMGVGVESLGVGGGKSTMGGVVTRRGLAIALPPPPRPLGAYTPTVQVGPLLFVSGMLPLRAGKPAIVGTIGKSLDAEAARDAVRLAVLNGLSAASAHTGTLDA